MITYTEFKALDKNTQVEVALEEGVVIGKRIENDDLLLLYQINSFYVELSYIDDLSEICAICHTDTHQLLDPYLLSIDISTLLQQLTR